ncbi:MAG: LURP-one-related family protein [Verrucomicrobiales bacterium]|nr:LURP-one-related family protein [Verrucomicrobiales bacterium]
MRFVLKQKFWSFGDDFKIQDANGQDVYFVDGRAFSWGDKLSFRDRQGNELAFIRQKLLSWGPTYEIELHGRLVAVVKKKLFTLLRCKFTVDVPGPDDLEAQGSFLDREYTIERHGRRVAEISKRWFSFTDTYGVEIESGEDPVLLLATAVVIDMVCHQESKER